MAFLVEYVMTMSEEWIICQHCGGGQNFVGHCNVCHNTYIHSEINTIEVVRNVVNGNYCNVCARPIYSMYEIFVNMLDREIRRGLNMPTNDTIEVTVERNAGNIQYSCRLCGSQMSVLRETQTMTVLACPTEGCPNNPDTSERNIVRGVGASYISMPDIQPAVALPAQHRDTAIIGLQDFAPEPIYGRVMVREMTAEEHDEQGIGVLGNAMEAVPQGSISTSRLNTLYIDSEVIPNNAWLEMFGSYVTSGSYTARPNLEDPDTERECYCCGKDINFQHHVVEFFKQYEEKDKYKIYEMWYNEDMELLCCKCMRDANKHGVDYIIDKKNVIENLLRAKIEMNAMFMFDYDNNSFPVANSTTITQELRRIGYNV